MTVYLVSCVSAKRSEPTPARDLYQSQWFLKARAYVESSGAPWRILSALHGVVHPDTVIAPYEKTLNTMPRAERRAWAEGVLGVLTGEFPPGAAIHFLAGQRYREDLAPQLQQLGYAARTPMAGLGIGQQLAWLTRHTPLREPDTH